MQRRIIAALAESPRMLTAVEVIGRAVNRRKPSWSQMCSGRRALKRLEETGEIACLRLGGRLRYSR